MKPRLRAECTVSREQGLILASCCLSPMRRNSVFEVSKESKPWQTSRRIQLEEHSVFYIMWIRSTNTIFYMRSNKCFKQTRHYPGVLKSQNDAIHTAGHFGATNGCQSTRHTVNSSQVNSSPSRLVTRRRSTRHKQTSKPYCQQCIGPPNFLAVVFKKQKKFTASSHQNAGLYI